MNIYSHSRIKHIIVILFLFTGLLVTGGQAKDVPVRLDNYIEKTRQDWKIPGVAVAIVKDGKVVLAKGFGVKEHGKPGKVDEHTLFAIASNTKAFTSAALAMLVDEGKIDWDDRVRDYLPYFTLYDPYVSNEMRVRDLLCHRTGLVTFSGDLLWYETPYTAEEVIKRTRFLKPKYGFRSRFGYSNIMFMAAGEVIPAVTGKSWKEFITERIIKPLGMKTTNVGTGELKNYDNVATPHFIDLEGNVIKVAYTTSDTVGAAAAVNSNASDMAQWLMMLLNNGKLKDKQYLSENRLREMWTPHVSFMVSEGYQKRYPTTHFRGYGLGWGMQDYKGRKLIAHGGGLDGMISKVTIVPEIGLGIVILTNSINSLPTPLTFKILDMYLGGSQNDWCATALDSYKKHAEKQKKQMAEAAKKDKEIQAKQTADINLQDYTGRYGGPMYGDATIALEKGILVLRLLPAPIFVSHLEHLQYDTFRLKLRNKFSFIPKGTGTVQFLRDAQGNIVEMKVDIPNNDFHFTELEFKKKK